MKQTKIVALWEKKMNQKNKYHNLNFQLQNLYYELRKAHKVQKSVALRITNLLIAGHFKPIADLDFDIARFPSNWSVKLEFGK